jgi:hypothetical protein
MPPGKEPQEEGLVASLKERRLPQIIIGYGAFAWAALQLSWLLVESNVLPRVVFDLALVAVVTGFPAVLTGAWFHGKKGRQEFEPIEYWVFGGLALIWLLVSSLILIQWRPG